MADLAPVYAALQQADAAGNTGDAQQLADYIRSQGAASQAAAPAAAAPQGDPVNRGVGLTVRGLLGGVGSALDMFADAGGADLPLPRSQGEFAGAAGGASDRMQLPAPQTRGERLYTAGVGSLPMSAMMGPEALIPGVAGSLAGQGVHEAGGNDFGAFLASVLAGGASGALQGGARGALESQATTPAAGSRAAQVAALNAEGVNTNLAQTTGNKLAQHIDRASQMVSSGAQQYATRQQQQFNGAVLQRIGAEGATAATPDVLQTQRARIGSGMDAIEDRSGAYFDTDLASALQAVQRKLPRVTVESERAPLQQNLKDMMEAAAQNDGTIPGAMVRQIKTNLSELQRNPALADVAGDAQEALQEAVARSSSPEDLAAYSTLRRQYRALKQIEGATATVNGATSGNINPTRLMGVLTQAKNRNQTLYGQGDQSLVTLARNAASVLPDTLGNSGTAERFIPTLTLLESLRDGNIPAAVAKTVLGVTGIGGAARALRNPRVVNALTSDRLQDTLAGIRGDLLPGAGYGAAGNAADEFLQHLDAVEARRRDDMTGRSSSTRQGAPTGVSGQYP